MQRYNPKEIEPRWQKIWQESGTYTADLDSDKPKYIAMSMFNYPSGAGIHIGHAMNYTISDVKARFKRQQGYESYHPVGWDAFGLPAENYAIKSGVSPQESMANIIPMYHKQYRAMGWSNDWEKEISTHLPEYYKWTQWIFAQMHKAGLAYQDSRLQWWCPIDKTVLANEQVIDGKCWRHDGPEDPPAEKREIKQWFFKITDYADELLQAIDDLDWSEGVKLAQRNWIGKSIGAEIDFPIATEDKPNFVILHGYTGRADKNFIPWLKKELENRGYEVQAPQMPNTDAPVEKEQLEYVMKNCKINQNTVLIGHSLGGAVAMKVLQNLESPIRHLVLVAPVVEPAFRPANYERSFIKTFELSYDYEAIKRKALITILSEDQEASERRPYLEYLADKLDAPLLHGRGEGRHFTGNTEPMILDALLPKIKVFTTRADTIYSAAFLVLAPEHELVHKIITPEQKKAAEDYIKETTEKTDIERQADKEKTGIFTGAYAVNPANGEKIPIWISDFVLIGYGTGAVFGDIHDERDFEFLTKFKIPAKVTVVPDDEGEAKKVLAKEYAYTGEGILVDSGEFSGLASATARAKIVTWLHGKGAATEKVNYRMNDWSISRQRYWGAPIPVIHCPKCGPVLVPDEDLPVILPELDNFEPTGDGRSALARAKDWLEVKCPQCGGQAERETDTLDTYIDSSWYMYRYFDPHNQQQAFNPVIVKKWEPIDFYNGADHATAHLLYARFIGHFFKKLGLVNEAEPFKQFLFNGKVMASDGTMFSKSKGNGVDPLEIIEQGYGADALRTYLMFAAPLDQWVRWNPQGVPGTHRFLNRVWNLVQEYLEQPEKEIDEKLKLEINRPVNQMIQKMTHDLENNFYNTAIAAAMTCTNHFYKLKTQGFGKNPTWQKALESLVACVAPFMPHVAEELWQQLGHSTSVHSDTWPAVDEKYLVQDTLAIVVQVNGKLRGEVEVAAGAGEAEVTAAAKANEKVAVHLKDQTIRKTVYVPGKLVNFVI